MTGPNYGVQGPRGREGPAGPEGPPGPPGDPTTDAELVALGGVASGADLVPYFTGPGAAAVTALTAYARSLLADTDAAGARSTLGLVIGTDVQAHGSELDSLAALTTTAFGRSLLTQADAAAARSALGLGAAAVADIGTGSTQVAAGDDSRFPSAGQKNALAGSSGVPGTTNTYVTDQDARNTNARAPTAHKSSHATAGSDALAPADIGAVAGALDIDNTLAANSDTRVASQKAIKGYVDTASGLLIPKALVDAKGDLLVGTADNTVARKAVGTNGQALLADSGASDGLSWVTQFVIDTHANRLAAAHKAGRLWKETDTGLIYWDDGSAWNIWKGDGVVRKTGDETVNNSNTLQNDDHLFLPVETGEHWRFEIYCLASCVTATPKVQVKIVVPGSSTLRWWSSSNDQAGAQTARDATSTATFSTLAGVTAFQVRGWVVADSAGNLQLQWAQSVATAENTTVLTDSIAQVRRLA